MEAVGAAGDAIVKAARADRHAAGHADARRERARVLEIDDRFGDQAGMNLQVPSALERAQGCGRDLAETRLDRGAVRDEARHRFANRLRHGSSGGSALLEKFLLGLDEGGERLEGDAARARDAAAGAD